MEETIQQFNHKRTVFKTALKAICDKHKAQLNFKVMEMESQQNISRIINNLVQIEKILDRVNFNFNDPKLKKEKIDVYLEIVEHSLSFVYEKNIKHNYFYKQNLKDNSFSVLKGLATSLDVLILIEEILALSTLMLAAAPTIIVTTLPAMFSVLMKFITPLLFLLPSMVIATCAIGALLLGLKVTQLIIDKMSANNNNDGELNAELASIKHETYGNFLEIHQAAKKESKPTLSYFFNSALKLDNDTLNLPSEILVKR